MAGRGRVKADEIDAVIGDYIAHSSLLWHGYNYRL